MTNKDTCWNGLHAWPENSVVRGGDRICRECAKANARRYKAKKRTPAEPPPADRVWRDIPGYEGLCQVSEYGDVWCILRRRGTRGGQVKAVRRGPYMKVDLYRESVRREVRIHILVALAFHGPMPQGAEVVRHLDDDKDNNHWTNLAYGTHSDNLLDRYRNAPPKKPDSIRVTSNTRTKDGIPNGGEDPTPPQGR